MAIPTNIIIGWPSTDASIPAGWDRITSLDGRHIKQIPNSSTDPGTEGGSATHVHTITAHTHTVSHTHSTANLSNSTGTVTVASAGSVDTNSDAHTHATGTISATSGATDSLGPDSDSDNNDPARWDTIFIASDGTPTEIPEGAVTFFNNATLPASWTQPANGKNKLLRGAATSGDGGGTGGGTAHSHAGGSHTHTSAHTHPNATAAVVATNTSESAGTLAASDAHDHVVTVTSGNFGTSNAGSYGASGNESPVAAPPWVKLAVITPPAGGDALQDGLIALWLGTLATIPTDWVLCDGANGTPDLCTGVYVMGCDALSELLNTGGTTTHTHTAGTAHVHTWASTAHTHTLTVAASSAARGLTGSTSTRATVSHAHADSASGAAGTVTIGTANPNSALAAGAHDPLHTTIAFIQYVAPTVETLLARAPLISKRAGPVTMPLAWMAVSGSLLCSMLAPPVGEATLGQLRPPAQIRLAQPQQNLLPTLLAPVQGKPFAQYDWPIPKPQRPLPKAFDPPNLLFSTLRLFDNCPAGPKFGSTAVNDAIEGDVAWSTPENATSSNDSYASCVLVAQTSQRLNVTNFGFNINPAKNITGIVVETEAKQLLGGGSQRIRLLKAGVLQTASKFSIWDTTEAFFSVGASDDLWSNSWTPADINDPNFGVSIRNSAGATDTLSVDSVRVTVYCADQIFSQRADWPRPQPLPAPPRVSDPPNLLTNTLAPSVAAPFRQRDWPILPPQKSDQGEFAHANLALGVQVETLPFRQQNWPKLVKPPDLSGEFAHANLALGVQVQEKPFNKTDWPIPPVSSRLRPAEPGRNLTITLPPPVAGTPFHQNDWPRLTPPAPRVQSRHMHRLSFGEPAEQPTELPFNQKHWPRLPKLPDLYGDLNVLNLSLGTMPFRQQDWPRLLQPAKLRVENPPNLLTSTLFVAGPKPFKQTDWALQPRLPLQRPADAARNITISLPVVQKPFAQTDWPIQPKLPIQRLADAPRNVTISLPPLPPFRQAQWPIQAKLPQQRPADAPRNILLALAPPFSQQSWPIQPLLPKLRPAEPIRNVTISLPAVQAPFSQTTWPIQPRLPQLRPADAALNLTIKYPIVPLPIGLRGAQGMWRLHAKLAPPPLPLPAARNITILLPPPGPVASGTKEKRKWRRSS